MAEVDGREGASWDASGLDELLALLAEGSLSARLTALAGEEAFGHIDVIAGGIADVRAGADRGDEAMVAIRRRAGSLRVLPRLPHPTQASLDPPGERQGPLGQRPVAALMRYCEEYVLTCALILERGSEVARIVYRRGEITATLVDGTDAPHRLPDVMSWSEGTFRIDLDELPAPRRSPRKAGPEPSTLFGYPAMSPRTPPPAQRPTPRVPMAAVASDPAANRPTPRAPMHTQPGPPSARDGAATVLAPGAFAHTRPTRPATTAVPPSVLGDRPGPTLHSTAAIPAGARPTLATGAAAISRPVTLDEAPPPAGYLARPLIVHVLVGVLLGLVIVAGYWFVYFES